MENMYLCDPNGDPRVTEMAGRLLAQNYYDAVYYYQQDDGYPYFKLSFEPKEPHDRVPNTSLVRIDVEPNRYVVHGCFIHAHFKTAEQAAKQVVLLAERKIAEISISFGNTNLHVGYYIENTKSVEESMRGLYERIEEIAALLTGIPNVLSDKTAHHHVAFDGAAKLPNGKQTLFIGPISEKELYWSEGEKSSYLLFTTVGEVPSSYVFEE